MLQFYINNILSNYKAAKTEKGAHAGDYFREHICKNFPDEIEYYYHCLNENG